MYVYIHKHVGVFMCIYTYTDMRTRHMNQLYLSRALYFPRAPHISTSALYRVAKTHRIPYLYKSFSAKVTYI